MLNTSVRELLMQSLTQIGIASEGYTPTAREFNDALYILRTSIDAWNIDGKMVYSRVTKVLPLQASKQIYTIGPGGDLDTPVRPSEIEVAMIRAGNGSTNVFAPMTIISSNEWARINQLDITSNIGLVCYLETSYPLAQLHVWPLPNVNSEAKLTFWNYLDTDLTLDSVIRLPAGYELLMMLNVAINVAPSFGRTPSDLLVSRYSSAKQDIQSDNLVVDRLRGGWGTLWYDVKSDSVITTP